MKVRLIGACRSDKYLFLKVELSWHVGENLLIKAKTKQGVELPTARRMLPLCGAGKGRVSSSCAQLVVSAPLLLEGKIAFTFEDGDKRACLDVGLDQVKWMSRFAYRFQQEVAYAMRKAFEREDYGNVQIQIDYSIPEGESSLLRAKMLVPYGDKTDFSITCIDALGQDIPIQPCFLSDDDSGASVDKPRCREVVFTFLLPSSIRRFILKAQALHDPALFGSLVVTDCMMLEADNRGQKIWKDASADPSYEYYYLKKRVSESGLKWQRGGESRSLKTFFSIVVPCCKVDLGLIRMSLDSISAQSYESFEVIAVECGGTAIEDHSNLRALLAEYCVAKVVRPKGDPGIAEIVNYGVAAAEGDFVCVVEPGNTIEPDTLFLYAKTIQQGTAIDLLYCDEDVINPVDGRHESPYFKPDFDIDLLRSHNYFGSFLCLRRSLFSRISPPTPAFDGAYMHNLALLAAEQARYIKHIQRVLHHCYDLKRVGPAAFFGSEGAMQAWGPSSQRAVEEHLRRLQIAAHVEWDAEMCVNRITYVTKDMPLVSIIVPNKDSAAMLSRCVESLVSKTAYGHFEIVIVDNNSVEPETERCYEYLTALDNRVQVVRWPGEFNFSKIVNYGVEHARGEYIVLLNNDTEVIEPRWLDRMLGIGQRNDVGVVGARLLYPDNTIQHAGIVVTDLAAPFFNTFPGLPASRGGYYNCASVTHQQCAVTAACCLTSRALFDAVGGFTEELEVAFNDVDYCLKVRDFGLAVVYEPGATLYHLESASRSIDSLDSRKKARLLKESAYMQTRWADLYIRGDPFLNPNLKSNYYRLEW